MLSTVMIAYVSVLGHSAPTVIPPSTIGLPNCPFSIPVAADPPIEVHAARFPLICERQRLVKGVDWEFAPHRTLMSTNPVFFNRY